MLDAQKEKRLIAAAGRGDVDAANTLCAHYEGYVFDLAVVLVHQETHAKDVLQTVMMKFYLCLVENKLKNKERCRPLLRRMAQNESYNLLGKQRRFSFVDDWEEETDGVLNLVAPGEENESAAHHQKVDLIVRLFKELTVIDQAIVTAYYIHNLKYDQLAKKLNVSVEFAKKRVAYVRRALKNKLKGI